MTNKMKIEMLVATLERAKELIIAFRELGSVETMDNDEELTTLEQIAVTLAIVKVK